MFISEGDKKPKYTQSFEEVHNQRYYTQVVNSVGKGEAQINVTKKQVEENIDDCWILETEKTLPAIEHIFEEYEKQIASEARQNIGKGTQEYSKTLAFNNGLLERSRQSQKGQTYADSEHLYFNYENKFAYTLVVNLQYFFGRRAQGIKDVKKSTVAHLSKETQISAQDGKKQYSLSMITFEGGGDKQAKREKRIDKINAKLQSYKDKPFMQAFRGMMVRPPIVRTPKILDDPQYKRLFDLWQFMATYEQNGFTVRVVEMVDNDQDDYLHNLCSTLALNCCLFNEENFVRQTKNGYKQEFGENSAKMALTVRGTRDDNQNALENLEKRAQEERKMQHVLSRAIEFEMSLQEENANPVDKATVKKQKEKQKEKEKAKEKQKKEKEKAKEKERIAEAKEKAKAKQKALALKIKAEEKAKIIKEKARQKAKELKTQAKQK